jgi:hypothetical protein
MINKTILNEGGNVEIDGIAAQRLDLNKVSRSAVVAEIDKALQIINSTFNKAYGVPLWSPELIKNKEFLSGSAFHFFNVKIPDDQFTKVKSSVGDIDTMVDKDLAQKASDFLTKAKGKQFGPAKLVGFKPNPGMDTLISLWQFNNPPVNVQIDMELVDYDKGSPTEWSKFSHSSAWEDLSVGVKGVFHKYLLRSLTHKDAKDRYIQMKTKLKKVTAADLAFAVSGGVRNKFEPVIDPKTKKTAVAPDGLPIYKEVPASESKYVTDIKGMFTLLIGRKPVKGEEKLLGSFVGVLSLINKYFSNEDKDKITSAFMALIFGPAAQQLYKGDPATDKREKEIALNKMLEILKVNVDKASLAKTVADYYSKYKAESITEADAPDYKRQGIKHIYNPGSTVEMKDVDFLAFIDAIAKNGGTLDNIPITLKVDGAGIRFGRDQSDKPFFMTSRVTNPIYADNVGMFEKYARDNNGNEEQIARAEKYDQALSLIVNSDFIKVLPKDTIVQAEMMYNPMAEKTSAGLKFVNIPYDPKLLGKQMTLVPIVASTYSTGEALPNTILQKVISKSTPQIKILGTELQHSDIDVKNIVEPIAKMDDTLRAALASRKKNDPAKAKAKEILTTARKAISDAIINSPNIKGKDKLGKTIEGLVIAMPNGQLAKVTSSEMKGAMAAKAIKKAPTTGSNRTKAAIVTAGSFVGHIGHQKVVDTVINFAKKVGGDPYIYISSKVGPDDPIPPEVKLATWKKMYPEYAKSFQLIVSPDGVTVPSPVKKIEKELVLPANSPYKKIVLMVGTDRYEGFKKWMDTLEKRMKDPVALAKYGGTQDQVDYETIAIPRGAALGGIDASFTQLRNTLKDPNLSLKEKLAVWSKGFGGKLDEDWIKKLMMLSAQGMGIKLGEAKSPWDKMVRAVPKLKGHEDRVNDILKAIKQANAEYQAILDKEKNPLKEDDDLNVRFHDTLNPALFRNNKMSPIVREKLLKIAEDFKDSLGVKLPNLKDITVSGSNAAFTYTPKSDIDLHLVVDLPEADGDATYRELFDAKKFQYNEQHDYKIKEYDVELYVQNANDEHVSQGIYSVMNDAWIKEPQPVSGEYDEDSTRAKYDQIKYLIQKALTVRDYALADKLRRTIKKYRQVGLHSTGEFGPENLAFKALRANGYIKKLYELLNDIKDKEFSLESNDQRLLEIDMSPGALKKFSTTEIAKSTSVGFEFEMIVPNMIDDGSESEPDYDYDEYVTDSTVTAMQDDLIRFFRDTETSTAIKRAVEEVSDEINDFILMEFDGELDSVDQQRRLRELYKADTSLEDDEIEKSIEDQDSTYDEVLSSLRDEYMEDWDNLSGFLEYNSLEMMSEWASRFNWEWPHYTEAGSDEVDEQAMREVADEIKNAVSMSVRSSPNYHAFKKNRESGVWYLETDSSINADESSGEGGLELVSPPLPLEQALEKLDAVLNWMQRYGAYTDSSTGFHMGVSIPQMENVDYIKLILFLGDKYVLDQFGRLGNSYTRSALDKMEVQNVPYVMKNMPTVFDALKGGLNKAALKMLESALVPRGDKYTSVNIKGSTTPSGDIKDNYIEFRSAGGDYLEAIEKIKNTLLRYVRVMALAADPNEAKEEYAKKLYKMLYNAQSNKNEDNVVRLFSMFASGNISKAELVMKLKAKQELRLAKKRGPIDYAVLDRNSDPITIVKAINNSEALTKGIEWERSNPVSGGVRGVRLATLDDIKAVANRNTEGQWQRWNVYGHEGQIFTSVSARNRQEASQLALRWGRENDSVISHVTPESEDEFAALHRTESKEVVTELANKPYPFKTQGNKKHFQARFVTDNKLVYNVMILVPLEDFEPNKAEIEFFSENEDVLRGHKITGTGDSFKVFATVLEIIKAYLTKHKTINEFEFGANKSEPSRVKLYDTMAKMLPKYINNFKFFNKYPNNYNGFAYHFVKVKKPTTVKENEFVTELANKPYEYDLESDSRVLRATFKTDAGQPYRIYIVKEKDEEGEVKYISVEFSALKYVDGRFLTTQAKTGTGDAFRIFATVGAVLKRYLDENPEITRFEFSGDKDEPSRIKLYDTMAKMLPKFIPQFKLIEIEKGFMFNHYQFSKVSNESKNPSSLKEYIEVSYKPFIREKKEEPKKELTDMQKACILGGQEYTGEIN